MCVNPTGWSPKKRIVVSLLCCLLGVFGAHRFYLGKIATGIIMLLTLGGFGFWALIDAVISIFLKYDDSNGLPVAKFAAAPAGVPLLILGVAVSLALPVAAFSLAARGEYLDMKKKLDDAMADVVLNQEMYYLKLLQNTGRGVYADAEEYPDLGKFISGFEDIRDISPHISFSKTMRLADSPDGKPCFSFELSARTVTRTLFNEFSNCGPGSGESRVTDREYETSHSPLDLIAFF
jgi:TM2 domain-containing membrane protein YozV